MIKRYKCSLCDKKAGYIIKDRIETLFVCPLHLEPYILRVLMGDDIKIILLKSKDLKRKESI
jgi:hypothetical protein